MVHSRHIGRFFFEGIGRRSEEIGGGGWSNFELETGLPSPLEISSWGDDEWITIKEAAESSSTLQCGEAGLKGSDSKEMRSRMKKRMREDEMDSNVTSTLPDSSNQEMKLGFGSISHPCKEAAAATVTSRNSYGRNDDHVIVVSAPSDSLS